MHILPWPRRLFALLLLFLSLSVHADILRGTPLLRRFYPEDYNAAPIHYSLTTDKEGRLFVGNNEGVLGYDGEKWSLTTLPSKLYAGVVQLGEDGHIYVGSYDSYGWLKTNEQGVQVYEELLTAAGFKGHDRDVATVLSIIATPRGVYFRSEHFLDFLSYDHRESHRWPLADNVRQFFAQGDDLYVRVQGLGFCRFVDGKYLLEKGGELFSNQPMPGVVNRGGWRLLVGFNGFFRSDETGVHAIEGNPGSELRDTTAFTVSSLQDGSFIVGTRKGEIFRYGPDLALRERINLGIYGINALSSDREGGLWAATEGDLVRMELPSPWSFIGAEQGLNGSVSDFEKFDGALWLATSRGFLRMSAGPAGKMVAEEKNWIDQQSQGFVVRATDSGLLLGHSNGLLVLDKGAKTPRVLINSESDVIAEIYPSRFNSNLIYALSSREFIVLEQQLGKWQVGYTLPLEGASAYGIQELKANEIWFGDSRGGPQSWTLDNGNHKLLHKEVFGKKDGLELDPLFGSSVLALDGKIRVVSGSQSFRYEAPRFIPDIGPPFTLVERPNELSIEETPLGVYAFTTRQMWFRPTKSDKWQPLHLDSRLAAGFRRLRYGKDGIVRVATWSGMLQFNQDEKRPEPVPLILGFESITVTSPDGQKTLRLSTKDKESLVEIPSGYRLNFRYSLVSMDSGMQFRFRLHGLTAIEDWTDWGNDRELAIRAAVSPGDYLLEVEARTRGGREAMPTSYRFRILPHWYELFWVRGIAVLFMFGLASLVARTFVRHRTQRYVEANRNLESRIAERTHELEEVNRKLAELATEDALTGVANRRALENGLQREWFRCLDQRRPMSVLMIDVDHFKRYNDTHGHLEGDVLLRRIGQLLQSLHDPKRELLARFGGEEFALLLPGVYQDEAVRRGEQIRAAIAEQLPETTVSVGACGFVPSMQADASHLVRRADAALYRAKRSGRNRVEGDNDALL